MDSCKEWPVEGKSKNDALCRFYYVSKIAFKTATQHPKEYREAHLDIDLRVRNDIAEWKSIDGELI